MLVQNRMRSESSRLANMMALSRANESSRLAALIRHQNECTVAATVAKGALLRNNDCGPCEKLDLSGGFLGNTINKPVPQSSSKLQSDTIACELRTRRVTGVETGVPQSVWTARLQQRTLDLSSDPSNPDARFSAYRRPFIQICPPIPQSYYTAGEPVMQGLRCGLPNKPDNPVLPG
jgi:hypothetical protein